MGNHFNLPVGSVAAFLLLYGSTMMAVTQQESVPLQAEVFEHIRFGKIKANSIVFKNQLLRIDVDESASLLMMPFDEVKTIRQVRFKWKLEGEVLTRNAKHETRRDGDDAAFKLGLLLRSGSAFPNPFVPKWLKRVKALLKFPSRDMVYLTAGARHAAGEQWTSPYNERVTMIAVDSLSDEAGWWQVDHHFDQPKEAVAIWLMADGDDTHSSFTSQIKDIEFR